MRCWFGLSYKIVGKLKLAPSQFAELKAFIKFAFDLDKLLKINRQEPKCQAKFWPFIPKSKLIVSFGLGGWLLGSFEYWLPIWIWVIKITGLSSKHLDFFG